MGVASGFTFPSDGDTSNATTDLVNNFNILKDSVNNVVSAQITDGTILNADISATAGIALSKITATPSDATLDNVLENFMDGVFLMRNSDTELQLTSGSVMINGELRRNSSATTNSPTIPDALDWLDVYAVADSAASTFTVEVVDSGTTPGGSSPAGTNTRLIGSIFVDAASDLSYVNNFRPDKVLGWSYVAGNGTAAIGDTIPFGVTFDVAPYVALSVAGVDTAISTRPVVLSDFTGEIGLIDSAVTNNITTTNFAYNRRIPSGTYASSQAYGVSWVADGSYS